MASRLRRRTEHGQPEIVAADHLRAGESKQKAIGTNLLKRKRVEFAIPLQGIAKHVAMLGKCGRIEDDQIIPILPLRL